MWKSNHSRDRDVMQFESDIPSIHSDYRGDEFTIAAVGARPGVG